MPALPATTRILIVEDDAIVREIVAAYLRGNGFDTEEADDAGSARHSFAARPFDLIIVDINLPDESGLELVEWFRRRRDVAIIFMTSLGSPGYRVRGLEAGDDYIVKPVEVRELLARVRAVMRRYRRQPPSLIASSGPVIEIAGWMLDLVRRELVDPLATLITLTRAEFDLFAALVQADGVPLSRDYLVEVVSSANADTQERTIDVLVGRIRKKLASASQPAPQILTQKGEGYRFAGPPS